jgi:hypothetical protein
MLGKRKPISTKPWRGVIPKLFSINIDEMPIHEKLMGLNSLTFDPFRVA